MSCQGWETYPVNVDCLVPVSEDRLEVRRRFVEASSRLFTLGQDWLEVMRTLTENGDFQTCAIESIESLMQQISINQRKAQQSIYSIRQEFSWGHFRLSQEAFERLLAAHQVFAPFLDVVQEFGMKVKENFHLHSCFRAHISSRLNPVNEGYYYEICYKVQYMEKNGRNRGDPWSLRQTGVYQQSYLETGRSNWIFLQLASRSRGHLEQVLRDNQMPNQHPMLFHTILLSSTGRNWATYVEHLHSEFAEFDEQACFSRVGHKYKHDFVVSFHECQKLQLLRHKSFQAAAVLDQCLDIARSCQEHCHELDQLASVQSSNQILRELKVYMRTIQSCRKSIESILQRSQGTATLVCNPFLASLAINYGAPSRSDKTLQDTNTGMQSNLGMIQHTVSETHQENATIAGIAKQGQKDSQTLKALTLVATMYLPATLVATVFSSNLIQLQSDSGNMQKSHYVIAPQFWIYVVSTALLMILTLGCTRLLRILP